MERDEVTEAGPLSFASRVARNVAEAIDSQGRKQVWLSEQAGIKPLALSRRLSGEVPFTTAELDAIAQALQVPVTAFTAIEPLEVSA